MDWLDLILSFVGGFGLFLFGMEFMGDGLEKAAGSKMKDILGALTKNRLLGVLVGAGVTALIQSSSATTVMVVGFVNVGLLNLRQAVGVIMGANIGTTITSWIVALGEWTSFLKPSVLAPIFIIVGVIMIMFIKNNSVNSIGQILFGFGALFLGMDMMSSAAKPLSELEEVKNIFLALGSNPVLGILTGAVVTAIIQSSSASVGILQALALAGLVPWGSAIYIILGQNIGTCITAILSSIGATVNAKRAAVIHLLFNIIGSIIFGIVAVLVLNVWVPSVRNQLIDATQISIVHSVFNILSTIILFPFANVLVHLAETVVREGRGKNREEKSVLDDRLLETPHIAVQTVTGEVLRMGELAYANVKKAVYALFEHDEGKMQEVFEKEREINTLQEQINAYLIKLSNLSISETDQIKVAELFHMVSDIERVGDHADNIAELALGLKKENVAFSEVAQNELETITNIALDSFEKALKSYKEQDKDFAQETLRLEEQVDRLEEKLRSRHLKRLSRAECTPFAGVIYLDLVNNVERISDHAVNIAQLLLDESHTMYIEEDN